MSQAASRIGNGVGGSLVRSLASDCAVAASVAQHLEAGSHEITRGGRLFSRSPASVERVARDFVGRGWLLVTPTGWRRSEQPLPAGLSDFLMGAAAMRASAELAKEAEAVVTLPPSPSAIADALPKQGPIHAGIARTDDEIKRIARAAVNSLTIMSPFVNEDGAEFAMQMFEESTAQRKLLITRMSGPTRPVVERMLPRMAGSDTRVLDYFLRAGGGYETFHAKVVIADGDLAYVGSANLTKYSQHSMELGIIVQGRAARAVSALVRAVETISNPVVAR